MTDVSARLEWHRQVAGRLEMVALLLIGMLGFATAYAAW